MSLIVTFLDEKLIIRSFLSLFLPLFICALVAAIALTYAHDRQLISEPEFGVGILGMALAIVSWTIHDSWKKVKSANKSASPREARQDGVLDRSSLMKIRLAKAMIAILVVGLVVGLANWGRPLLPCLIGLVVNLSTMMGLVYVIRRLQKK